MEMQKKLPAVITFVKVLILKQHSCYVDWLNFLVIDSKHVWMDPKWEQKPSMPHPVRNDMNDVYT